MLKTIKRNINDFKEAYKAAYELSNNPFIYPDKYVIDGIVINHYPKVLKARGVAVIMIDNLNQIFVDDLFFTLSESAQKALIQHELGHLNLGHTKNIKKANSLRRYLKASINKVQDIELEADKYSFEQGYDIINALKEISKLECIKLNKKSFIEITNRISILENY